MTPVLNLRDTQGFPLQGGDGQKFSATVAPVGAMIGTRGLGCMYVTLAPGKRAFPFHNHLGNDEMFVILEGEGIYRLGDAEHPVTAGCICAAPRGGPDTAHQLVNTGETDLKYLGISTMNDPDVVEYPDSGKYAAMAIAPGPDFMNAHLKVVGRPGDSLDYWDGEI
jgi:uncharacterized cupin superfamily protein